jgi:hypothetical protein
MDVEVRLIRETGTDLLGFLTMQPSKIVIEALLSLPGRIFGLILDGVRVYQSQRDRLRRNWSQLDAGLGGAKWGLRPHAA